jgi:peptidoglycan/xylan/chitin deacetylase (PgdA/CDA1 family)
MTIVPILLYHSISSEPSSHARSFTVSPDAFREQLDHIVEAGLTPLKVSSFVNVLRGAAPPPGRPIVITFDDGFSDFYEVALPLLRERELVATLYVTTGFLRGRPDVATARPFDDRMLSWSQLAELAYQGVEIGGHSHGHPQLDTLPLQKAWDEITKCKELLETELGAVISSFAYPHGYSSPRVRRLVREAGYESACSVKNALSSTDDDPFSLARLTLRAGTSLDEFGAWLRGCGARTASPRESLSTRIWRFHRRMRAVVMR